MRTYQIAVAEINGSTQYPNIRGQIIFYPFEKGTIVKIDINGLPSENITCKGRFFGFHIHEGTACLDDFQSAGGHYNPQNCSHPDHAGDMPVLEGNSGRALMSFYTERFTPDEIKGRTVIIHDMPDDFRTQPAGDSGMRIACGVIK